MTVNARGKVTLLSTLASRHDGPRSEGGRLSPHDFADSGSLAGGPYRSMTSGSIPEGGGASPWPSSRKPQGAYTFPPVKAST